MNDLALAPETPVSVPTADGLMLQATRFGEPVRGSVVIASALGVPRRFYRAFAQAMAARGFAAWTFDYRGIGDSHAPAPPQMHDWGLDIDALLRAARLAAPQRKLLLVGHSAGGQLPGLAAASEQLDGAVFVAATAPRADHYPLPGRLGLQLLWRVLIPLFTRNRAYLPPKIMGQGNAQFPAGVMREWARWATSEAYLFDPRHGLDVRRYARLAFPILSLGFDDDHYAPSAAIEALLGHYPAAPIERRIVRARDHGGAIGHFGFFRPHAALWQDVSAWMEGVPRRS